MINEHEGRWTDEALAAVVCAATGPAGTVTGWASEPLGHEEYNELLSGTEHTFVGQFPVECERPRFDLCGELISLADAADADSWVHSADANEVGDPTAEYSPTSRGPDLCPDLSTLAIA